MFVYNMQQFAVWIRVIMSVMKGAVKGLMTEEAVTTSDLNTWLRFTVVMGVSLLYVRAYVSGHCTFHTISMHSPRFGAHVVSSKDIAPFEFTYLLTPWSRVLLEKLTSKLCS